MINLNKVKHFDRVNFIITLENNVQLPVARAQKEKLMARFGTL
ncbi:LytTR family transcriptional regulator DNA-binding domain-containing protein [Niabella drilacis]|nr:LytTR family transcriptional regulator DNA-binding domain-containing protein [Niabella drilacis]